MISDAFWLSRVVAYPETDFYLAAEALRRVDSPHWKFMLREGLRLKDEAAWEAGLKEAAYAFDGPGEAPSPPARHHKTRAAVRQRAANP
jgi:hypothetical protein